MPHQGFSSGGAHPGDIIQYRFHLSLTVQGSVILNCKAVSLVLDSGDQLEPFRMGVDRKFDIMILQTSGTVVVILVHTAVR